MRDVAGANSSDQIVEIKGDASEVNTQTAIFPLYQGVLRPDWTPGPANRQVLEGQARASGMVAKRASLWSLRSRTSAGGADVYFEMFWDSFDLCCALMEYHGNAHKTRLPHLPVRFWADRQSTSRSNRYRQTTCPAPDCP